MSAVVRMAARTLQDYHDAMAQLLSPFDDAEQAQFRDRFAAVFGAPGAASDPGCIAIDWMASPVGPLLLGAAQDTVVLVEYSDPDRLQIQAERLRKQFARPFVHAPEHSLLGELRRQLEEYFAGQRRDFQLPLRYEGSSFQERVWSALRQIPYGETCSYGALARQLGDPKATRAVGAANGANPIAIVIPCHRVVNAGGELGGYGGGLWRKQFLLDLEQGQQRLF
jgi:AraC family transcriptional regulator of adaptative response/methylated-DNA-[protein]-cysteine methyltransferase